MGLQVAAARPDLGGGYFRSDHFSFAKAGVPAFSIEGGHEWLKDKEVNDAKRKAYGKRYHQVDDEYDPSWNLSGAVEDLQLLFAVVLTDRIERRAEERRIPAASRPRSCTSGRRCRSACRLMRDRSPTHAPTSRG